ncbi:MAG: binding-protein-dependent transporter inner rane component [Ilumatobacteraceae bacterium]|nr:binding-protein-dependent transporter inner rane component [Ilumatobacteraceae bacterium]
MNRLRAASRARRPPHPVSWIVLILCAVFFAVPIIALVRFSFQKVPVVKLGWSTLFDKWTWSGLLAGLRDPKFQPALFYSLRLVLASVLLTLVLLLPTAMLVHLRLPRARGFVEILTILPYVVPPITLAAGALGAFRDNAPWLFRNDFFLVPFYAVMAMPFSFRALDAGLRAIDLRMLVDASRSLGAGWTATLLRVLIPNLRVALISSSFLTATVVLGEFTLASLLFKPTLPVFLQDLDLHEARGGSALALLTLIASGVLLGVISLLVRTRRAPSDVTPTTTTC